MERNYPAAEYPQPTATHRNPSIIVRDTKLNKLSREERMRIIFASRILRTARLYGKEGK